ncbi:unnamed protein product [Orchesella dallaii]|uniref:Reelin domain-containing protein n=1 Tax=Orchesella dallaii TaxID=48710 RepID=A0ABP1Q811_9HEXA
MDKIHLNMCSVALSFLTALLLSNFQSINGYPDGAPERACEKMNPGHGEQSLNSNSPYEIKLDRVFVRGANRIKIQVVSTKPSTHKLTGLLIMVKKPAAGKRETFGAFGTFDPKSSSDDLKTISCFGMPGSGLTHSDNKAKTALSFEWIAPNDTSAEYELHATLVRDYNSFWSDIVYPQKIHVSSDAPVSSSGILETNTITLCILTVAVVVVPLFSF